MPSDKLMRKHTGKSTKPAVALKGQKVITLKDPMKSFDGKFSFLCRNISYLNRKLGRGIAQDFF